MSTKWLTCLRTTRLWYMIFLSEASSSSGCFFWMRVAKNDEQFQSLDRTATGERCAAAELSQRPHQSRRRAHLWRRHGRGASPCTILSLHPRCDRIRCVPPGHPPPEERPCLSIEGAACASTHIPGYRWGILRL